MEKYLVIGGEEGGVLHHFRSVCAPHGSTHETPRTPTRCQEVPTRGFLTCEAKTSLPLWPDPDALPLPAVALLLAAAAVVALVVVVCLSFDAQLAEDITFKYVFQM